jgi:hypothetical protein
MAKADKPKPKKKAPGRARSVGGVVPFLVELDPAMARAIDDCRAKLRWTRRAFAEAAFEALLKAQGSWPPPD